MLRNLLRLLSVLLLTIVLVARFGAPALLASEISSTHLVELANKDRQSKGLAPLKYNKKLERAALLKAENMMKLQYWAHYGPNKESPWQFILEAGYKYAYAGENLAKGFSDTQSVHEAWMASPTHRANILDAQFQDVGIAVVKGKLLGSDVFLVVQMFGSPTYNASTQDDAPSLKITNPQDGDILEDGITDIRGETFNMGNPTVTAYLNRSLLGSTQAKDGQFALSSPLAAAEGNQTISAKAIGPEDTYLVDSVIVTVVNNQTGAVGAGKECTEGRMRATGIQVTYTCQREISNFSATVGSTLYTHGTNIKEVSMPLNSLPQENATVILSVTFSDGSSTAFASSLEELGRQVNTQNVAGTTNSPLLNINFREVVFGLFIIAFLLLIIYAGELAYKRQLLIHRSELMSFVLFFGILIIAFNFGFVRV